MSNVSQTISDTATDQYLTTSIPVRTYYESLLCTVMEGNMSDNINEVMNEVVFVVLVTYSCFLS